MMLSTTIQGLPPGTPTRRAYEGLRVAVLASLELVDETSPNHDLILDGDLAAIASASIGMSVGMALEMAGGDADKVMRGVRELLREIERRTA